MTLRRVLTRLAGVAGVLVALVLLADGAAAHPLGNFTVNVYSGLRVQPERVLIDYVVDLAEIPTFQARATTDADGNGTVDPDEQRRYRETECDRLTAGLRLRRHDRSAVVRAATSSLTFPPGQAGLPTLRLECSFIAQTGPPTGQQHELSYRDDNLVDRIGWREVTAVGDGTQLLASDVAPVSVSTRLTAYPAERLQSPLNQRQAQLTVGKASATPARPGAAGPTTGVEPVDRVTQAFTSLVAVQDLTPGFGLLAAAVATLLGGLHAVAPGHGKTVMAAYLLGRKGSPRQALLLGLTVAVTHTTGVLVLGFVLSATQALAPERVYPWLGLLSGLLFAAIGASLLRQALYRSGPHDHHHHHHLEHDHPHHTHDGRDEPPVRWHGLVAPGLAGGLAPSPSALVVLLGGIALGRVWYGLLLVVVYGLGMAAALVGAGLLLVRARGGLEHKTALRGSARWTMISRALPTVAACVVLTVGLVLVTRAVMTLQAA